jgi:Bacterial transglutaminase-like cysteine proteinase BTLCP
MRGIISIVFGLVAIGAFSLGFTVDLRASLQHDPFGGDSVLLHEDTNSVAAIWSDELARIAIDQETVKACKGDALSDCHAALKLITIVEEASGYYGRAKLGHINRAMYLLLRPSPGAWLSPLDVLRLGTGDCKDYALAKYFALRQAGVGPDRLRLVIVHNKQRAQDHMVVAAYQGSGWLILDNRTMALVPDVDASSVYAPLFVLDDTGARQYVLSMSWGRLRPAYREPLVPSAIDSE